VNLVISTTTRTTPVKTAPMRLIIRDRRIDPTDPADLAAVG
jgi:hypothetical protein